MPSDVQLIADVPQEFPIESRYQHKTPDGWGPWGEWKEIGYFDVECDSRHAIAVLESINDETGCRGEYRMTSRPAKRNPTNA